MKTEALRLVLPHRTTSVVVKGADLANDLAAWFVGNSAWFAMDPEPGDFYRFWFKPEREAHVLLFLEPTP